MLIAVHVQIDQAGNHQQSAGVESLVGSFLAGRPRQPRNAALPDTQVQLSVHSIGRVHHPASRDDPVVMRHAIFLGESLRTFLEKVFSRAGINSKMRPGSGDSGLPWPRNRQ